MNPLPARLRAHPLALGETVRSRGTRRQPVFNVLWPRFNNVLWPRFNQEYRHAVSQTSPSGRSAVPVCVAQTGSGSSVRRVMHLIVRQHGGRRHPEVPGRDGRHGRARPELPDGRGGGRVEALGTARPETSAHPWEGFS